MANTTVFGLEIPDYDADEDAWGTILNAYFNAVEPKFPGVLISNSGAASAASAVLTIPDGWRETDFRVIQLAPATNGAILQLTASVDAGANYLAGTTYLYGADAKPSAGAISQIQSSGDAKIVLSNAMSNVNPARLKISLNTTDDADTYKSVLEWSIGYINSGGTVFESVHGHAFINTTSQINRLKLQFSAGNIATSLYSLHGVRGL